MNLRKFASFDYILFICVSALVSISILFIYSSGVNSEQMLVTNEYFKQIIFAITGCVLMIAAAFFDYRKLNRYAPYLFAAFLVALIYTKLFGRYVNGARSWLGIGEFGVQPSEFGKIIFILFLARFLERSESMSERRRFLCALGILCLPVGLILLQPDLGTASVYIPIFIVMCFMADIPLRYIMLVLCSGILTIIFAVLPIWQQEIFHKENQIISILTNKNLLLIVFSAFFFITLSALTGYILFKKRYYFWLSYFSGIVTFAIAGSKAVGKVLKNYQIKRLIVFLDPQTDPLGAGWNIIQSKTAIGAGGIFGQGYLQGTQSHFRYLPQQSTDFIFSIISEEWGFFGSLLVCLLFLIIIIRIIFIIKNIKNIFGYYIASGILSMLFFHFIVNIGMVIGIMPITGIPLLFLSYGGSSLWTAMTAIGLLMSIHFRYLDY
ncbi:MAG: rod shape-determining protein RodA [Bacteroides sp.]|nr:rod shape-determining protein RodA [Prevotella sp.]MCM1407904.1 rod shape-determining protein RodA [Treponema brennaborense]MCM1469646.1 rod shape-determining protein RodA [Bacteroides sp.]